MTVCCCMRSSRAGDAGWLIIGARCSVSAAGLTLAVAGCATPVRVARVDPREVERQLDSDVISTHQLSEATRIVLHRANLLERFDTDPEGAIASLHRTITAGPADPDMLFALTEMLFLQTLGTGQQQHALSAAVYAYAFLFPEDPQQWPSGFDPRLRTACDIYNRSLTRAFASADRSRIEFHAGRYRLSFGSIENTFDPAGARWGDQILSNFTPADELRITGLKIRYRRPGLGASLAANATPQVQEQGFQVEPDVKVPVTALLRVETSWHELVEGHLRGHLEVYPAFEPSDITIAGQSVPLEVDTSTAFAFSLSDPKVWESELVGFSTAISSIAPPRNSSAWSPIGAGRFRWWSFMGLVPVRAGGPTSLMTCRATRCSAGVPILVVFR